MLIRPLTSARCCSLCDVLLEDPETAGDVSNATWFLSHTWSSKLEDTIDSVLLLFEKHAEHHCNVVFWFDIFSTAQHRTAGPSKPSSWWMNTFRTAIRTMGKLVMAADRWNDPTPLKRAWCVLELHAVACEIIADKGCFELAFTPAEHAAFILMLKSQDAVEKQCDSYYNMLGRIRSEAAECSRIEDRQAIHKDIEDTIGFSKLDRVIFSVLERWMEKQIQHEHESSVRGGEMDDAERMRQARANLLAEQGDFSQAISLGEEKLVRLNRSFPPTTALNMKAIGRAMLNLSINYDRSGKDLQRCLELRLQVLKMWKSFLPPVHRDLADVMSCVGSSLIAIHDYEGARSMHEGALAIWRQCLQPGDPHFAELPNSLHNLGVVYQNIRLPHLALQCREECLKLRRSFLSASHPDVLLSEADLAISWYDNSKEQDGLRLLEKVLLEAKRVLPPSHGHLGTFMNQLGTIYGKLGRFEESLRMFEEQLKHSKLVMEPGNYEYINLYFNMSITLMSLGRREEAKRASSECVRVAKLNGLAEDDPTLQSVRKMMQMFC
jgi:tetratricopeptide (TPR) repeat protein